jgi:UDP-N-acetylglucosamine 2-epimerase (non-hydrolysing)
MSRNNGNNRNNSNNDGTNDNNNEDFILVTLHRSENVDNRDFLKHVLTSLSDSGFSYIFPMHPHTLKRVCEFGLEKLIAKTIKVIEPVGYLDFLRLLQMCRFVITDSGGVEEEITSPRINKSALILRDFTERPESIRSRHAILCKNSSQYHNSSLLKTIKKIYAIEPAEREKRMRRRRRRRDICPYGSGNSAENVLNILQNKSYI